MYRGALFLLMSSLVSLLLVVGATTTRRLPPPTRVPSFSENCGIRCRRRCGRGRAFASGLPSAVRGGAGANAAAPSAPQLSRRRPAVGFRTREASETRQKGTDLPRLFSSTPAGGGGAEMAAAAAAPASESVPATPPSSSGSGAAANPRSRWARKKERKRQDMMDAERGGYSDGGLEWETFEFSRSPKMDRRFEKNGNVDGDGDGAIRETPASIQQLSESDFQKHIKVEADLDKSSAKRSDDAQNALFSLSPDIVRQATEAIAPYVQDRRQERIDHVLSQRTRRSRFLFENPSNPSNAWACLRTIDSFGLQYVDIVIDSTAYDGKAAVAQKSGMRTAMGSARWLTLRQHSNTREAVRTLKDEGYRIYASDLNPNSKDVRDIDWNAGPICVVMGNEERGISQELRDLADETFTLPMSGFAESFNLSVATAITLAHMSASSRRGGVGSSVEAGGEGGVENSSEGCEGPLRPGDLGEHEVACLKLKGMLNSLAKKKLGAALLKKEGIVLPKSLLN